MVRLIKVMARRSNAVAGPGRSAGLVEVCHADVPAIIVKPMATGITCVSGLLMQRVVAEQAGQLQCATRLGGPRYRPNATLGWLAGPPSRPADPMRAARSPRFARQSCRTFCVAGGGE